MPKKPIVCPRTLGGKRHVLQTNATVKPLGLLECTHRPSANQAECRAKVMLLAMPGGWHYVAIVTEQEVRVLDQMSGEDAMAYLLNGSVSAATGSTQTSLPLAGTYRGASPR